MLQVVDVMHRGEYRYEFCALRQMSYLAIMCKCTYTNNSLDSVGMLNLETHKQP